MRQLCYILICSVLLSSCQDNKPGFEYDPTVSYPLLNPGDFWIDKFDQRGLQNAIIYRDKIYCNTIDVGGDGNFLYCLNPKNGLVVWRGHVEAFASQTASFFEDKVIYCSYLGNISAFDSAGKTLWKAKFGHPYGGHWLDTTNKRLLVKTVYWKYVSEYNLKSGKLISDIKDDSLQRLIERKIIDERLSEIHNYQFVKMGKTYTLLCRPSKPGEIGKYTIEITR